MKVPMVTKGVDHNIRNESKLKAFQAAMPWSNTSFQVLTLKDLTTEIFGTAHIVQQWNFHLHILKFNWTKDK